MKNNSIYQAILANSLEDAISKSNIQAVAISGNQFFALNEVHVTKGNESLRVYFLLSSLLQQAYFEEKISEMNALLTKQIEEHAILRGEMKDAIANLEEQIACLKQKIKTDGDKFDEQASQMKQRMQELQTMLGMQKIPCACTCASCLCCNTK